ncbi:hypothetical protein ACFSYG_01090 [Leeuwenhoekiella polynyae]|uniref:Uncharacterized protein n=1 Tax=Leeuwenhoekiella polynyae TaxID=1550906 RepID=A0A4Q0P841_9FLAO|nr:hypothetical protein DSM02_1579 [Leeuwenhoekiella polynyae]
MTRVTNRLTNYMRNFCALFNRTINTGVIEHETYPPYSLAD